MLDHSQRCLIILPSKGKAPLLQPAGFQQSLDGLLVMKQTIHSFTPSSKGLALEGAVGGRQGREFLKLNTMDDLQDGIGLLELNGSLGPF